MNTETEERPVEQKTSENNVSHCYCANCYPRPTRPGDIAICGWDGPSSQSESATRCLICLELYPKIMQGEMAANCGCHN